MAVQIQQYGQTQTPQGAALPTSDRAPGAQTAAAISGAGKAITQLGNVMDDVHDRNAQVEATRILSAAQVAIQAKSQELTEKLGTTDPTGFAGHFNDAVTSIREGVLTGLDKDAAKNPYLQGHLRKGFDKLQQDTMLNSMKIEHEAISKFRVQQVGEIADNAVKMVTANPTTFAAQREMVLGTISLATGIQALDKKVLSDKVKDALASSAIGTMIDNDPASAKAVLGDDKNPMTADLSPEKFKVLKDQAEKMFNVKEGEAQGNAIGLKASTLAEIPAALEKITDPVRRKIAEQSAFQTYSQRTQAKTEYENNQKDSMRKAIWVNPYAPLVFPKDMPADTMLYMKGFQSDVQGSVAGFGRKTDLNVWMKLHDMRRDNPTEFAKIDMTQFNPYLTQSDAKTFSGSQSDLKSGRSNIGDIRKDGMIKEASKQIFTKPVTSNAAKRQRVLDEQSFQYATLARIQYMESEVLKRQATPEELQDIVDDSVRYRNQTPMGWFSGGNQQTLVEAVPGQFPKVIAETLLAAGRDPSPAQITAMYNAIREKEDEIKDYLIEKGRDTTEEEVVREFLANQRGQ